MRTPNHVSDQVLRRTLIPTGILALALVAVTYGRVSGRDLALAVPMFCLLYGALFTVGQEPPASWLHRWIRDRTARALAPPAALVILLYAYCAVGGGNPLRGTGLVLPSLLLLPVAALHARRATEQGIGGADLIILVLFVIPLPGLHLPFDTKIPFTGHGFDEATRVVMIVVAVYAFVAVRGVPDVGAVVVPRWRPLALTVGIWLAFFGLCFVVAAGTGFATYVGHGAITLAGVRDGVRHFFRILLHTALFEELFFRGLLQNMVAQRIAQAAQWRSAWRVCLAIFLPLALVAGYTLSGGFGWLPAAVCLALFASADRLERRGCRRLGDYTALAIVGTAFGLVHYHAHSVVFIALAMIAGWAYGYLYLRTRNLLYPILIHTLINSSPMLFGLALVK